GKPTTAYWYQLVTANITDKLLMFDWSPPELMGTGSCPVCGFGMIPTSAHATAGAARNGSTQPAGPTTVHAAEVLVGTDLYGGFTYTSDCSCAAMYSSPLPTASQGVTGSVTAVLDFDTATSGGYQYLEPLLNTSFNIK